MNITRPLIFIDIEGTGTDPATDRIVEFALVKLYPDGKSKERCARFNPGIPIPEEAIAIHGITDAMVADCPPFSKAAPALMTWLRGCDLAGYNLLNYDVPLLWEEFYRAGIEWDLTDTQIIDVGNIFKKKEQRTLSAAVKFYCDREHEGAHGALSDSQATAEVLKGQRGRYEDLREMSVAQLAEFSRLEDSPRIDLAGTLVRDSEGFAVYTHKRVRGVRLADDEGYAYWMLKQSFSQNTLFHVRAELEKLRVAAEDAAAKEQVPA